jgi:hypothetical protein
VRASRPRLIREFRVFLEACRKGDRRWKGLLLQDRRYEGVIEVDGRLRAYELMARFLDEAERRDRRRPGGGSAEAIAPAVPGGEQP